jgi:hypothetical protein
VAGLTALRPRAGAVSRPDTTDRSAVVVAYVSTRSTG